MRKQLGPDLIELTLTVAEHRLLKQILHRLPLFTSQFHIFQCRIQRVLICLALSLSRIGGKVEQIGVGKSLLLRPGGDVDCPLRVVQLSLRADLDAAIGIRPGNRHRQYDFRQTLGSDRFRLNMPRVAVTADVRPDIQLFQQCLRRIGRMDDIVGVVTV